MRFTVRARLYAIMWGQICMRRSLPINFLLILLSDAKDHGLAGLVDLLVPCTSDQAEDRNSDGKISKNHRAQGFCKVYLSEISIRD